MKTLLFAAMAAVLVAAAGLQIYAARRGTDEAVPARALKERLLREVAGWTVEEQAIAETAEMKRAVGELLNFDDAILLSYRRGGRQFDVYAAYWKPGKMSQRLVAGHTPDVCWVGAGWRKISAESEAAGSAADAGASGVAGAGTRAWFPEGGEFRVFDDPGGARRWVAFWHLAGGRAVSYGNGGGPPPWWSVFSDLAKHGLDQKKSQYFVRVSANVPWEELAAEPGFAAVMAEIRGVLK